MAGGPWWGWLLILTATVGLSVIIQRYTSPRRPRVDQRIGQAQWASATATAVTTGELPACPEVRTAVGFVACVDIAGLIGLASLLVAIASSALILPDLWTALLPVTVLTGMVAFRARRSWVHLRVLHTAGRTGRRPGGVAPATPVGASDARVADMTSRTFTAAAAITAMALAVTACGSSSEPESAPAPDLASWSADNVPVPEEGGFSMANLATPDGAHASDSTLDVEAGWYAVTVACEPTESETAPGDRSAKIVFSGESGNYGGGDCSAFPITTTMYFGIPDAPAPETFSVKVLTDGQEVYWGLSASPTTSPE